LGVQRCAAKSCLGEIEEIVPIHLPLRGRQVSPAIHVVVVQRSVDTVRFSLQNAALPYQLQYAPRSFLLNTLDKALYQHHVMTVSGKDSLELFFGRLKYAESCVGRAIMI
jgi:hypothetical protein